MDSTSALSSSALHSRLRSAGYELLFRGGGWVDCLVLRDGERWQGRGTTEEDALDDALRQMLPSHLARTLLDADLAAEATAQEPLVAAGPAPRDPSDATAPEPQAAAPPPSEPAEPEPAETLVAAPADEPPAVAPVPPRDAPEAPPAPVAASAAPGPDVAPPGGNTAGPAAAPAREPAASAARPIDAAEGILQEIERRHPDLAQMSADRQRLEVLVWICRARSLLEDTAPGTSDVVESGVSRVARRLREVTRVFWPGYVGALQLTAEPDELQELRVRGGPMPETWTAAAVRAQQVLATQRAQDRVAGFDEHGWADAASLVPRPADPDSVLEEVAHELGLRLGPLDEHSEERVKQMEDAQIEALVHAAHRLRWIRGAVDAPLAWGAALGRLRRVAHLLGPRAGVLRSALDARVRPSAPWQDMVEPPAPKEDPAAVVADLRASLAPPARLVAWIVRAFDVMSTPEIATLLTEQHVDVAVLEHAAEDPGDRRLRRRLRELVRRLRAASDGDGAAEAPTSGEAAEAPAPAEAADVRPQDALTARVRARTEGKRALFVGNREDRTLEDKLTELLGMSITWCDGSPRKVQAQCARLAKRGFDIVLCASGFQSHSVDAALSKAAQTARVPYVRVNRGRPAACVQALAREFGLLQEAAAV
jgi:hypothetical protein